VLQLGQERVPDRFETMDDATGKMELEEVGRAYKFLAGFDMESVKRKVKDTKGLWASRTKSKGNRDHNS
jgi:hypothetical protein